VTDHQLYETWAWLVLESDGTEGTIAVAVPGVGALVVLQCRQRALAEGFGDLARAHGEAVGRPVRLAHLLEVRP
jgi:hypothetical protein